MDLLQIFRCLADETRSRILHLLTKGPLCVCHFQSILKLPQVAVSKHLAYLRANGMVDARRHEQWMIYSVRPGAKELELQLACLRDCVRSHPVFREDLNRLHGIRCECNWVDLAVTKKTRNKPKPKSGPGRSVRRKQP